MRKIHCALLGLMGLLMTPVAVAEEDVIQRVQPIVRVSPVLPEGMNANNMQQGYVLVQFEVNEQGDVENPQVIESQPAKVYDQIAIDAVKKFKFSPQLVNGKPVRITATQTFEFEGKQDRKFNAGVDLSQFEADQLSFTLNRFEQDFDYKSTLVVTNLTNNQVIKKQAMPDSEVDWPMLASDPNSPYLFFYHSTSRKKAKIKVYQRSDLKWLRDIDVEVQAEAKYGDQIWGTFRHLNDHQLLVLLGRKDAKLVVVDAQTGAIEEKFTFKKNSKVALSDDKKYVWGHQISLVPRVWEESELFVLETDGFNLLKTIPLRKRLESVYYYDDILELTFIYESIKHYRKMLLRLTDLEYLADFKTSNEPGFVHGLGPNKSRVFFGKDESGRYLKVAKIEQGVYSELSDQEFEINYNLAQIKRDGLDSSLLFYGQNKFLQYRVFKPSQHLEVKLPFDVAAGFFGGEFTQVYLTEKGGSDLALVDLVSGNLVATEKSNMGGLRLGHAPEVFMGLSIDVPANYQSITAMQGFQNSNNLLFLDDEEHRLFALRIQSSHITSFLASNLSDEHTVDAGRQTFQLAQKLGGHEAPVLAIGVKQITLLNPKSGQVINQFKYDGPIAITEYDELVYWKDKKQKLISLNALAKGE